MINDKKKRIFFISVFFLSWRGVGGLKGIFSFFQRKIPRPTCVRATKGVGGGGGTLTIARLP